MKILITGAKGMLGTMLASVFADMNPTLWDVAELDITDLHAVREKLQVEKPEVIINAAAYTEVDKAEGERDLAFAVNATGPGNLATVAKEIALPAGRQGATLVHYSTDYVFPGTKAEGYAEDDAAGPAVNVYGESKLAGEEAVKNSGCNFYLLRTAWLYGPNGKNFVDTMLKLADTKPEISVVNDQHGSPTFTKDLAGATKYLLENTKPFGIYHAVNAGQATWYDLACEVFKLKGKNVKVNPIPASQFPTSAKRPEYSILKNTKGLPMRDWKEALADYLQK
jgi:dTDP-4-dehydrorhamnose reductase